MINHKSRKNELLHELETTLLKYVSDYVEVNEGALVARSTTQKQLRLLLFCSKHHYNFHCIVILHGLIKNQQFNNIYKTWECFHGKKRFMERQNAEAYWINKALTYKHLTGIITHH